MPSWLKLQNGLALIAALIAAACFVMALYQFVIGQHYIIPTMWLLLTMITGNFARYALAGARWAQEILFWCGALASSTLFMGLFFAQKPKELLGGAFLPVWGLAFLVVAGLTFLHARGNGVFSRPAS